MKEDGNVISGLLKQMNKSVHQLSFKCNEFNNVFTLSNLNCYRVPLVIQMFCESIWLYSLPHCHDVQYIVTMLTVLYKQEYGLLFLKQCRSSRGMQRGQCWCVDEKGSKISSRKRNDGTISCNSVWELVNLDLKCV